MTQHLSNVDTQRRELETIYRMFALTGLPTPFDRILSISSRCCIIGINIPYHYFLDKPEIDGDIDLFVVPLEQNQFTDTTNITPDLNRIIVIEVKTMTFTIDGKIVSPKYSTDINIKVDKKQHKTRSSVKKLCSKGFNDVYLVYIINSEPMPTIYGDLNDWFVASERINKAKEIVNQFIVCNDNDEFSSLAYYIGALEHKSEDAANSSDYTIFNLKNNGTLVDRQNEFRIALENMVSKLFPLPVQFHQFPIQIRACSKSTCKHIYTVLHFDSLNCPKCGENPL